VKVFGAGSLPKSVKVGGNEIHGWSFDEKKHTVTLVVEDGLKDWTAEIAY
jgi:hypothetical protein